MTDARERNDRCLTPPSARRARAARMTACRQINGLLGVDVRLSTIRSTLANSGRTAQVRKAVNWMRVGAARRLAKHSLGVYREEGMKMTRVRVAGFTISLDGYGAASNQYIRNPLGVGAGDSAAWQRLAA